MFKFLRKYNKIILAVGGVLLMITFLIPQAIQNLSQEAGQRGAVYGTVGDGEKVAAAEIEQAQRELEFIEKLPRFGVPLPEIIYNIRPEHWFLLVREAQQAGLIGTSDAVELPEQALFNLRQVTGERSEDFIKESLAKLNGVNQMLNLFQTGGLYSDRRLLHNAERLLHQVNAQVVSIQADKNAVAYEPSEEEILAQMEKYAEVLPGKGENGFGYKLPDRVKLEWMKIPVESVRKVVQQSKEFSTVAQRYHWTKNEPGTFPPVDRTKPIPDVVRNDLLEKLTKQKMDEIARDASEQLRLNRRGIAEREGYVVLPADWSQRKMDLQQLANNLQNKYGIDLPSYESTGDRWLAVNEVSKLEGIGTASTDKFGDRPIPFASLVADAKEFGANVMTPIQQDVASPPLRGADGSTYIFRIIATDPSRKPSSIDEVRDAVVADLKRAAHYKQLTELASSIEQEAESKGLLLLAVAHNTSIQSATIYDGHPMVVKQQIETRRPVEVTPSPLPGIGSDRKAIQMIIDYALSLPSGAVESLPEERRTFTLPVDDKLTLLVIRLTGQTPLNKDDFADLTRQGAIQALVVAEESEDQESIDQAFGFDAMVKRNNFSYRGGRGEQEAQGDVTPPANAAANAG